MKICVRVLASTFIVIAAVQASAVRSRYAASGLVVDVDRPHQTVVISHGRIPGYMDAMVMPFHFRPPLPAAVQAGDEVDFTLAVDKTSSWVEQVRVVKFESAERDPLQASRLKLLESVMGKSGSGRPSTIAAGQAVPDFTLTDQSGVPVRLSQFVGKVVAIDFVYTRCPLPDYCFRMSNNFARLQKRFGPRLGGDLILLTVTFDPVHDTPEILAGYAKIWNADLRAWHFLTGAPADVQRVSSMFGAGAWTDEGLLTHSLHTALIGREGKLAANLEGNRYTAAQLGDLVETVIRR